jgi:transcriptional regulator
MWLRRHVGELTAQQEAGVAKPWAVSDAPDSFIAGMARAIVGIRLPIARLEGKWKMSQNRELKDREGVLEGLRQRDAGDDREIAAAVRRAMQPDG